jgi:hypothetical protein
MKCLVFLFAFVGCASNPRVHVAPQTTEADAPNRFKERYGELLVDSTAAPEWMIKGAGCALGQTTTIINGETQVVPAHFCVAIESAGNVDNSTCEAAEARAWTSLSKLFGVSSSPVRYSKKSLSIGGKTISIQGAKLDATWRGSFNGAQVCALQIAWPVAEFESLQASWGERGDKAQQLYESALPKGLVSAKRCEHLKQAQGLLDGLPGNRKMTGKIVNSDLLEDRIRQAFGEYCGSEKTVVMGLSCSMDDEPKPCNKRLRSAFVGAFSKAGWQVVGSDLSDAALTAVAQGDQAILRKETASAGARFLSLAKVSVEKVGNRGRLMFCRANLDLRILDGRSGSAVTTFEYSSKRGGLGPEKCYKNTSVWLAKKSLKTLNEALGKQP